MAQSTCTNCGNHSFEIIENTPMGSHFKLNYVQCSKCGGVIGVMQHFDAGMTTKIILEKIGTLENTINNMYYDISDIKQKVR